MSCKKQVFTAIKPSTAPGVLPTVLSQFEIVDGAAVTVDPTTITNCPETTYQTSDVCYVLVAKEGEEGAGECLSGKCTIAISFDCSLPEGEQTTITTVGITAADGSTTLTGTEAGQAQIVPCPEITVVSQEFCVAGKTEEGAVEETPVEAPVEGRLFN